VRRTRSQPSPRPDRPAGTSVRLATDPPSGDTRDRYGRPLAYVDSRRGDLGERQLRAGLATVYRYRDRRVSRSIATGKPRRTREPTAAPPGRRARATFTPPPARDRHRRAPTPSRRRSHKPHTRRRSHSPIGPTGSRARTRA
jgi:hypothetical protein